MSQMPSQFKSAGDETEIPVPAREFFLPGGDVAVVFVHGFAGTLADLQPLVEHERNLGRTVVGVRLPGHGHTPERLSRSTAADWQAAVRAAVRAVPADVREIILVGESMGGLLAVCQAQADPRIRRLVLLAPPFRINHERRLHLISRVLPKSTRRRKPWLTEADRASHAAKGSLFEITVGAYREFLEVVKASRQALRAVKVPMLAIFSQADQRTSSSSMDYLRLNSQSGVTTREVPGDAHHLLVGPGSAALISEISHFIAGKS